MVGWRGMLALAALAFAASTAEATTIHIRVDKRSHESKAAAEAAKLDKTDCEINGVKLRHRSLHYYADKSYVACKFGIAACHIEDRHHTVASQVSCPTKDLQKKIDAHRVKEEEHRRLSLAVVDAKRKWGSGVVCYAYNPEYPFDLTQRGLIADAMHVYEKETNVRFLPVATCKANQAQYSPYCNSCVDYVDFKHPPTGRDCNSSIGVNGAGPQIMNLADRCFEGDGSTKNDYGTAMHEIGHSLGLYHEHQHPQRTIAMFWDDIPTAVWGEMKVRDSSVGGAYDPDSVMHYPDSYGFCYPKFCTATLKTNCVQPGTKFCNLNDNSASCVEPKSSLCDTGKTRAIGQRRFLSQGDLDALNELYPTAAWPSTSSKIIV
jgi:hypothetical protein